MVFDALTKKSPFTPDRYLLTALQTRNSYLLVGCLFLVLTNLLTERLALYNDGSRTRIA